MFDRRLLQNFDWLIILVLFLIGTMSILNLYSATFPVRGGVGSQIFVKQIYWYIIGFGAFVLMTTFSYCALERFAYPIYLLSVGLLLLVLVVGKVTSGSQRWIPLFGFNLQPSELAKIGVVICLAKFFSDRSEYREYRLRDLWQPFVLICIPAILIVKEPDLGTALLLLAVSVSMLLFVRIRWKSLMILVGSALLIAPFIWFSLKAYQQRRILTFLMPDLDPLGAGYHINQSKIAIGSGLVWGKGFMKGTQTRLHFLPEQHTDFAFSVWAEEWGFLGSALLLFLYLILVIWALNISRNSKDKFGAMLGVGLTAILLWQVLINVGMVTGLLPVVGIPLVLFSYGGSSLVTTMTVIGLLMNIRMRRFMFQ